jgi:CRISPR-associated protein Cas1
MRRSLHDLPRFSDRWSYLYLERGRLDRDASGLVFHAFIGDTPVPIDQLNVVLLGPGTTITHAAVKALAENSCMLAWVGEFGVRFYAHGSGSTFSSRRLLHQARMVSDDQLRLSVVQRMYQKRFPGTDLTGKSIEQIRGMEGIRVRAVYGEAAKRFGIEWSGRNYDQDDWHRGTPANRALSAANSCLYAVCHAAIVSAGYSPAMGFIHTGKMLSFVYDVADFYKTELTVPLAFEIVANYSEHLERVVRKEAHEAFYRFGLMNRILPDIAEVLGARDDLAESPEELEGRVISLADRTDDRSLPGQPEREDPGETVAEGG